MQNELLDLIDDIEATSTFAEMSVCNALLETYSKSCMILENCSDDVDISSFEVFQEGVLGNAINEAKGDKSENIIIRILKFIPRLIAALIRNIKTNRKSVKTRMIRVEKLNKEFIKEMTKRRLNGDNTVPKGGKHKSYGKVEVTESYDFTGLYADGDTEITIENSIIDLVSILKKESVDFAAVFLPLQHALESIVIALSDTSDDNELEQSEVSIGIRRNKRHGKSLFDEINNSISESEKILSKNETILKNAITSNEKRTTVISLTTMMNQYKIALDWMAYVEQILQTAQRQIQNITNTISNTKTLKTEFDSVNLTGKTDKASLSKYANKCQQIVQTVSKLYTEIIQKCYAGLDQMHKSIEEQAREAGITLSDYGKRTRSRAEYHGLSNSDLYGYINGDTSVAKAGKQII